MMASKVNKYATNIRFTSLLTNVLEKGFMQEGKLVKLIFKSRLMPSQPKEKSGRPFVSLILTVCKESPKARIDYKLVPQETGSYQELS